MQLERIKKKSKSKLTNLDRAQQRTMRIPSHMNTICSITFPVCFEKSQCMYFGTLLIMKTKNIKSLTHIMPEPHSISTAPMQSLPNLSEGFSTEIIVSIGSCIWFGTFPMASYLYHKFRLTFSINTTLSRSVISTVNVTPNTWAWDNSEHQLTGCAYSGCNRKSDRTHTPKPSFALPGPPGLRNQSGDKGLVKNTWEVSSPGQFWGKAQNRQ